MSTSTNLAADIAAKAGTAFQIISSQCESLDGQIKSTAQNYDRLVQVVTLEGAHGPDSSPGADDSVLSEERTFFMIGTDTELNASSAGFNNEVYVGPGGKTEIFILPANLKIKANRRICIIVYGI